MPDLHTTKNIPLEIKELLSKFSDSKELQQAIIIFLIKEKKVLTEKELHDYYSDLYLYVDMSISLMQLVDEGKVGVKDRRYIMLGKKKEKLRKDEIK